MFINDKNLSCRDGHSKIILEYLNRIQNTESYSGFSLQSIAPENCEKMSFTQKLMRSTQRTFLNPALEIKNLSFYHTNNTFSQH